MESRAESGPTGAASGGVAGAVTTGTLAVPVVALAVVAPATVCHWRWQYYYCSISSMLLTQAGTGSLRDWQYHWPGPSVTASGTGTGSFKLSA